MEHRSSTVFAEPLSKASATRAPLKFADAVRHAESVAAQHPRTRLESKTSELRARKACVPRVEDEAENRSTRQILPSMTGNVRTRMIVARETLLRRDARHGYA
jgi:hypothetical protein